MSAVARAVLLDEVHEERRGVGLRGDDAKGVEVDQRVSVRVAGVPSGDLRVVVEDVADVPAEDDVAEAEARLGDAPELVERDVLAAEDAVDVEAADLDLLDLPFVELLLERRHVHGPKLSAPEPGRHASGARFRPVAG